MARAINYSRNVEAKELFLNGGETRTGGTLAQGAQPPDVTSRR